MTILSVDYLAGLLNQALAQIALPQRYGVVLEGSIAEGFGNETSDIDFLLITDDDRAQLTMPTLLFVDGRRVEIRIKSIRKVEEQATAVIGPGRAGGRQLARISEDLLNRCQRLAGALVLREHELIEAARAALPRKEIDAIVAAWYAHFARQSARHVAALDLLGQPHEAATWSRVAVIQAAKAWAAARGESYVDPKWLPQQLTRIPNSTSVQARVWALEKQTAATSSYLDSCFELVADLGVQGCGRDPERIAVTRRRGVTTWGGRHRVHVMRDGTDVFALGPAASKVWRSIVFSWPLTRVIAGTDLAPAETGALLAEFHRLGLIHLSWQGGATITPAQQPYSPMDPITLPPSTYRPILGTAGALFGPDDGEIKLVPMTARRFSTATLTLLWANVMVENAREDVVGALRSAQWRVAELTARRMLQYACRGILAAYGAVPLPPDGEVVRRLNRFPDLPAPIKETADRLDGALRVSSAAQGDAVLVELDEFVRQVRNATGAELFPASFDSSGQWQLTLELAYDWIRLGAYVKADFPIEEARDLLESKGEQPHPIPGTDHDRSLVHGG